MVIRSINRGYRSEDLLKKIDTWQSLPKCMSSHFRFYVGFNNLDLNRIENIIVIFACSTHFFLKGDGIELFLMY